MFKPFYTLLFLLGVAAICAVISLVFPKEGIVLSKHTSLHFFDIKEWLEEDTAEVVQIDVEQLLESYEEPFDSTAFKDSVKLFEWSERQKKLRIQYASSDTDKLHFFFKSLQSFRKGKDKIRIIHYGDSQIEGDRITSFIRNKYQVEYGGYGPGYTPVKSVAPSMSIRLDQSENWHRYTVFGRRDTTVKHRNFGMYGVFNRFTSALVDTAQTDTATAWVTLKKSVLGYGKVKSYRRFEMLYGNVVSPFECRIIADEEVIFDEWILSGGSNERLVLQFSKTPKEIRIEFKAVVSPDIYGIRLEENTGFIADNVPMRGSAGTVFRKMSGNQLSAQYKDSDVGLIILQYGGNTVPYIDNEQEAKNYGNWMKGQIKYLKKLNPGVDIVFIGPSDMATKDKTQFVSFPYLENVRDELKKAALETGCGFWDIYEVMGGRNSMASWVDADPPLAGKDYVHFTPKGAKRIAELFYDALDKDFQEYLAREEEKRLQEELKKQMEKDSLTLDSVVNENS